MREMKDTGLEWIDRIPEDWSIRPLKSLFDFGKGLPITKDNLVEVGLPVISYGQIHAKWNSGVTIHEGLKRYVPNEYLETGSQSLVHKGDFIFADTSEDREGCGNCAYVDCDDTLFAGYHTIILKSLTTNNNRYLAYLFLTDAWRSQIRKRVTGVKLFSISKKILGETSVILPSASDEIVNYLDIKASQISDLIANEQTQIEKLKAYKQSLITEVVTKGLDPSVPMKDSGVEWIGEIPEHWGVLQIARAFQERNEPGSDELPILTVSINTGISSEQLDDSDIGKTVIRIEDKSKYKRVHVGDIAYNTMRAWQGAIGSARVDGVVSPAYVVAKPKLDLDTRYTEYLLRSASAIEEIRKYSYGIMDFRLRCYWQYFRRIFICIPPRVEQEKIADFLDKKLEQTDRLIELKQSKIDKLDAYKKSLIYEYVTGKKEVV